ncbi:MAG: hybrid sensor histidine kinase/response regulator [Candidatus Kapabacteria bacterium]|nr:hybrid sensor histidine kinase/response regulator [Ignavibacteriota bacterium]MCW5886234.1 hybrid sensor histidine kinase/response regulator [Candidatus Kapabacteria bacterium]
MQYISDIELVLIVDDNPANIEVAVAHLHSEGYRTATAKSAREALESIKQEIPDLLLLDIMMPVVDGFELCKLFKSDSTTSDIPVIFLTALNQPDEMVKGFNHGAVDYITKPFNKEELISRVRNHLNLVKQTKTIKYQNEALKRLNEEKNGIIELTAHDLNNPLQSVIGYSDLIIGKLSPENSDLISYAHSIKSSAQKAVNIIKDLMEVNLIEEGKLKLSIVDFDLRDTLMKVVEGYLFQAEAKKQVLIYDEPDLPCIVNADRMKLERIFDNLLSNAIKFSKIQGKIYIKCDYVKSNDDSQDYVVVSIQDSGPGFTNDDKSKIFTKFAKLSAKPTSDEPSTGLGLSIVKKLTELLNGQIHLVSSPDEGSTFYVKFPVAG